MTTRLIQLDDAPALSAALRDNRDFLGPWEPVRDESYFTEAGQQEVITSLLRGFAEATTLPHVILDGRQVVGRITLTGTVRGPFQSANLGYWVVATANGRGLATAAVREIARIAFADLKLHRIEAGALLHNAASQKVLARNGFIRFGTAPKYLKIAGEWQDHAMFQLLTPDPDDSA
ncbi:GNAT family N-acetyltransferase [Actinoplanes sp. CA-051413]|uniref:GNAT family N-acetyltransferase n=1 Tax=Actinoplanes sp. CA-051413 TaxID=3239899 RepID=UPI003D97832E